MMRIVAVLLVCFIYNALDLSLFAQLPPPVIPNGVGVNIHFVRGHTNDLDMIAGAGFKFIRMDFSWSGTERKKGEYDWSGYDELTANLEKRGIRPLYILDYSNPLYEESYTITNSSGKVFKELASPQRPESIAAFARWAGAAAAHYKGRGVIWEIWNEPNISFWKPKPDVHQYIALAKATIKEIRKADPKATIIAPASSSFPWSFFEEMFKAGLLEELDAISVHPYRGRHPETVVEDYTRLRMMIDRYASPAKKKIPIVSGEWGYATHTKGVSLETQAAYLVRQQIINLYCGVQLSIWYDWKNDGTDPTYNEHNFGTVTHDLKPKPAYIAVKNFTKQFNGFKVLRRLPYETNDAYIFLLTDSKQNQKLVCWSVGKPAQISINIGLTQSDIEAIGWDGTPVAYEIKNGTLSINLSQLPVYVTLKKKSIYLSAASAFSVIEPNSLSVMAGENAAIAIPVVITNPFPNKIEAIVNVKSVDFSEQKKVIIAPDKIERLNFKITPYRRDIEIDKARVQIQLFNNESPKTVLGEWVETIPYSILNSIKLDVAPVKGGYRVALENKGSPLNGRLVYNKWSQQVSVNVSYSLLNYDIPVQWMRQTGELLLYDRYQKVIARKTIPRFEPVNVSSLKAYLDGDSKIQATLSMFTTNLPSGLRDAPSDTVYVLDYDFDTGWRFARVAHRDRNVISGNPVGLGVWVYGDNSKNLLRMRVVDDNGQTFQPNGPAIDWTGWRWIEFDIKNLEKAGYWGGTNDGIRRGNLRLDTLLILDSSSKKTKGRIMFWGFAFIYDN